MMLSLLLVSYGAVFVSELIGDKTLFTISSLSMRFRPPYVFFGLSLAYMLKMLAAVSLGRLIAELPTNFVTLLSAAIFLMTALVMWFKKKDQEVAQDEQRNFFSKAVLISFATIFFSEWGDVGQITAATLSARYQMPLVVWLGATAALVTKGLLAVTLGRGLRDRVPRRVLRPLSAGLCLILSIVSAFGLMRN